MYVITIFSLDTRIMSAHPYCPESDLEAWSVARELARDFPNARVLVRDLRSGRVVHRFAGAGVYRFMTGGMLNA